jgi:guanylate kinase
MTMSRPLLFLISAPSGAGKTTVCNGLLAAEPSFRRVITCTTRPPRDGERDGVDYHFLSPDDFAARVSRGEFLEHASVYGRAYGTLKSEVVDKLNAGHDVLLNIDVQGAASVRAAAKADVTLGAALVTVFFSPPTLAELEARLRGRGADSEEVIQRRLREAKVEAARWGEFDYLVVSGSREEDLRRMRVIFEAEKLRSGRARFQFTD